MLGKLLKYEFKAMGRTLLPLYGALLAVAAILGLMINFSDAMNSTGIVGSIMAVLIVVVYVVLLVAIVVMTMVLIVQRFSRNLLGTEGYFMLTLPASIDAHILSKTISAMVWSLFSGIVGMVTLPLILLTSGSADTNVGAVFNEIGRGLRMVADEIGSGNLAVLILEVLLIMILTGAAFALKVYASISVGHQVQKHTGLLSLAVFIGLCIVESVAGSFVGVKTFEISGNNIEQQVVDSVLYAQQIMLVSIVFTAVVAAIYYVITRLLMKYKLNLE
ncbi:hypothetical protein [Aminicella lysinilytica]|uniref:Uncharacterized protein n=1 Tax=Aminicella lysinilytica TaxID=433323 RepID=A0A4R6PXI1_9FIRM|nr:hypothetical protein [Aminicella lysinilytica]TDP48324.1 hypothetical protein EV211_1518 [Aminicella lysinilytica]